MVTPSPSPLIDIETTSKTWAPLLTTVNFLAIEVGICLVIYSIQRRTTSIFQRRREEAGERAAGARGGSPVRQVPPLPSIHHWFPFDWLKKIPPTHNTPTPTPTPPLTNCPSTLIIPSAKVTSPANKTLHDVVGLDAFVFLSFLSFAFEISFYPFLLAAVLLFPTYATSSSVSSLGYNSLTIGSLGSGDKRIYIALIFSLSFTAFFLQRLLKLWHNFLPLRMKFLNEGGENAILLTDVPDGMNTEEGLEEAVGFLLGGSTDDVIGAVPMRLATELELKLAEREVAIIELEKLIASAEDSAEAQQIVSSLTSECEGALLTSDKIPASTCGVVILSSLRAKTALLTRILTKPDMLVASSAPNPKDVNWANISNPFTNEARARSVANALALTLVLFLAPILTLITSLGNLENLKETFSFITITEDSPFYGVLQGLLPVILLSVFFALVPILLSLAANKIIKFKSKSQAILWVFEWHSRIILASFAIILVAGSLFSQLQEMLDDPGAIVELLALAVPESSTIFANYALIEVGAGFILLSQAVPALVRKLFGKANHPSTTARAKRLLAVPDKIEYEIILPKTLLILLVAIVYGTIAPLALIICAANFFVELKVYTFLLAHTMENDIEGGGELLYPLSSFTFTFLYIGEAIWAAYLGLQEAIIASVIFAVFAIGATVYVHKKVNVYVLISGSASLLQAALSDEREQGESGSRGDVVAEYRQPCLVRSTWVEVE